MVVPVILPDFTLVKVQVVRFVLESMVAPNKLTPEKLHDVNIEPLMLE